MLHKLIGRVCWGCCWLAVATVGGAAEENSLRVGTFEVDVSPPLGSPLAYNRCDAVGLPLTAKGIVLVGSGQPIVLCAVDWIGISNGGYERWREVIAQAVATTPQRVSVHTLHQHDAPRCDFSAEVLLAEQGLGGEMFDVGFARQTLQRVAAACRSARDEALMATQLGLGQAKVEKVASNRRILGPNGKVKFVRYTTCKDPKMRAEPEGIIDPYLKSISFWQAEKPLVVLTYYATHPQSYYLTGVANPDFPGMARLLRQSTHNGLKHVHFNGAGGNIGAGKYNDGAHENRQKLAIRLAQGMAKAYEVTEKRPLSASDVSWETLSVALPVSEHLQLADLEAKLKNSEIDTQTRTYVAKDLIWLRRCLAGEKIDISCLSIGAARVLHMPGELAVEYQLAAQKMRPDLFVAMAAYGEYAPGYICLEEHYSQGGYEDSPRASKVSPKVEAVLMQAIDKLLQ